LRDGPGVTVRRSASKQRRRVRWAGDPGRKLEGEDDFEHSRRWGSAAY